MTPDDLTLWYNFAILHYLEDQGFITNYKDDLNFHAYLDHDTQTLSFSTWQSACAPPTYQDLLALQLDDALNSRDVYNAAVALTENRCCVARDYQFTTLAQFANPGSLCYEKTCQKLCVFNNGVWQDISPCDDDPIKVAGVTCNGPLQVNNSLTSLNGGLQLANPQGVTVGAGTTLDYYQQGLTLSVTLSGGDSLSTTTCKVTRIGSLVHFALQPTTLSTISSDPYIITGSTGMTWTPPYPVTAVGRVTTDSGNTTLTALCEIATDGTIQIHTDHGSLTRSTTLLTGFVFIWDLS